ncbi:MAG: DUF4153 domain-containing protein [Tissierellia bacterium]|nr:DUF4153 domain-containing protein [Tissierellia bacterium]
MLQKFFSKIGKGVQAYPIPLLLAFLAAINASVEIIRRTSELVPGHTHRLIQLALYMGISFSMMAVIYAKSTKDTKESEKLENGSGILVAVVTYFLLATFGIYQAQIPRVSGLANYTIYAICLLCVVIALYYSSKLEGAGGVAGVFFILQKSFWIALLYGVAVFIGGRFIIIALEGLLGLFIDSRLMEHLAVLSFLIAYIVFVGLLPDFSKSAPPKVRMDAKEQPQILQKLFCFILIPIIGILSVVLLLWMGKILITRQALPFEQLSTVVSAYSLGGIWLYLNVTEQQHLLVKGFRRFFPPLALILLLFEAYALFQQIQLVGIRINEYPLLLIWIFSILSIIGLLFKQEKSYRYLLLFAGVVLVLSFAPVTNYRDLPVNNQISRLRTRLEKAGMLHYDHLSPATEELDWKTRYQITSSIQYLTYQSEIELPVWIDSDLNNPDIFKKTMGFEIVTSPEPIDLSKENIWVELVASPSSFSIADYETAILLSSVEYRNQPVSFEMDGKFYELQWQTKSEEKGSAHRLRILSGEEELLNLDLMGYLDGLSRKYVHESSDIKGEETLLASDLQVPIDTPDFTGFLQLQRVSIARYQGNEEHPKFEYNVVPTTLYLTTK